MAKLDWNRAKPWGVRSSIADEQWYKDAQEKKSQETKDRNSGNIIITKKLTKEEKRKLQLEKYFARKRASTNLWHRQQQQTRFSKE